MNNANEELYRRLEQAERDYRAGDREQLFKAVRLVLRYGLAAPDWIVDEFAEGYRRYQVGVARELGEAFGIQRPRQQKVSKLQILSRTAVFEFNDECGTFYVEGTLHDILRLWCERQKKHERRGADHCTNTKFFNAVAGAFHLAPDTVKSYYKALCDSTPT